MAREKWVKCRNRLFARWILLSSLVFFLLRRKLNSIVTTNVQDGTLRSILLILFPISTYKIRLHKNDELSDIPFYKYLDNGI